MPNPADPGAAPEIATPPSKPTAPATDASTREIGGPQGPEPTRFGDWERNGRCIDF